MAKRSAEDAVGNTVGGNDDNKRPCCDGIFTTGFAAVFDAVVAALKQQLETHLGPTVAGDLRVSADGTSTSEQFGVVKLETTSSRTMDAVQDAVERFSHPGFYLAVMVQNDSTLQNDSTCLLCGFQRLRTGEQAPSEDALDSYEKHCFNALLCGPTKASMTKLCRRTERLAAKNDKVKSGLANAAADTVRLYNEDREKNGLSRLDASTFDIKSNGWKTDGKHARVEFTLTLKGPGGADLSSRERWEHHATFFEDCDTAKLAELHGKPVNHKGVNYYINHWLADRGDNGRRAYVAEAVSRGGDTLMLRLGDFAHFFPAINKMASASQALPHCYFSDMKRAIGKHVLTALESKLREWYRGLVILEVAPMSVTSASVIVTLVGSYFDESAASPLVPHLATFARFEHGKAYSTSGSCHYKFLCHAFLLHRDSESPWVLQNLKTQKINYFTNYGVSKMTKASPYQDSVAKSMVPNYYYYN